MYTSQLSLQISSERARPAAGRLALSRSLGSPGNTWPWFLWYDEPLDVWNVLPFLGHGVENWWSKIGNSPRKCGSQCWFPSCFIMVSIQKNMIRLCNYRILYIYIVINVNPGLINHDLLIRGGTPPIVIIQYLNGIPPIKQPMGLLIQDWHYIYIYSIYIYMTDKIWFLHVFAWIPPISSHGFMPKTTGKEGSEPSASQHPAPAAVPPPTAPATGDAPWPAHAARPTATASPVSRRPWAWRWQVEWGCELIMNW